MVAPRHVPPDRDIERFICEDHARDKMDRSFRPFVEVKRTGYLRATRRPGSR